MRVRFLFRSAIGATALALISGCTPIKPTGTVEPQPETRAPAQPVVQPAPPPAGSDSQPDIQPSDETIGFQIRRLLNTDPNTGAGVTVEVDDGNVTLRGTAVTRAAAWRAEGAAHSVKGVKSVVNQIIVNAPSVTP
jgi:BON domain